MIFLLCCLLYQEPVPAPAALTGLIAAFNAHDAEAMMVHVAEDIVWYGLGQDGFAVEAQGKAALLAGMKGYFKAVPTVKTKMEGYTLSGSYVAYKERVSWQAKSGPRQQIALAVYQIKDGLIQRVWYYPAES